MSSCAPTFTFNFALDFLFFSHLVHLLFSLNDHLTFVLNSHRNLQCPVTTNPLQFFKPVSHCKYSLNFKRHFVSIQRSPGLLASENRGVSRNTPSIYLLRGTEPDSRWMFLYSTSHVPLIYTEASSARQPTIAPNTLPQKTIQLNWLYTAAFTTWTNKESHVILKDV